MVESFKKSVNETKKWLNEPTDDTVQSFLFLRKAIGWIGVTLPFALAFGKYFLEGPGIQPSISAYYYTIVRGVFVGSLWAIGIFLLSYRGHHRKADLAGNWACVFAIGTALFPTTPDLDPTPTQQIIGYVHYASATCLFLILAYFCLGAFKTPNENAEDTATINERRTYTVCGVGILLCIATIFLASKYLDAATVKRYDIVFWFESLAIIFFGISWFVRGKAISDLIKGAQILQSNIGKGKKKQEAI